MSPTHLQAASARRAVQLHRQLAEDIARLREDAGLTRAAVAGAAGLDPGYISRIESGTERPTLDSYARIAAALGADLSARLYPNTGPAIRDRLQARMLETLLDRLHPRWRPYPEVAVRRPVRGWIDVGLHEPRQQVFVATELQSMLRRLEQIVRWSTDKAAALPSWDRWADLGEAPAISSLLVVRATRATRDVTREFDRQLRAAYPAHPDDALASLCGTAPWPGPALIWMRLEGASARLIEGRWP